MSSEQLCFQVDRFDAIDRFEVSISGWPQFSAHMLDVAVYDCLPIYTFIDKPEQFGQVCAYRLVAVHLCQGERRETFTQAQLPLSHLSDRVGEQACISNHVYPDGQVDRGCIARYRLVHDAPGNIEQAACI